MENGQQGDRETGRQGDRETGRQGESSAVLEIFHTAIFDTIPDPLVVLDRDLNVLTANDAFFKHFKIKPEETLGRRFLKIDCGQWDIPQLQVLLEKILSDRSVIEQYEITHDFNTIGKRTIWLNARELKSTHFLPMNVILIAMQDITDRKIWTDSLLQLNEQLQKSNDELDNLGQVLSHDLRAPIRAIAGFTKIILSDYKAGIDEGLKGYFDRIIYNTESMDKMIVGLSQLSRLGQSPVNRISINLSDVALKIIDQFKTQEPQRRIEVTIEQGMTDAVEPNMIIVALTNLFQNAFKFTRDRSPAQIEFGGKDASGKKIYFVKDNGVGFDMKDAHSLFVMFRRLHSAKDYEGTGAGLAIVKKIINRHNGEIWANSEEGKGTTFYFTLNS